MYRIMLVITYRSLGRGGWSVMRLTHGIESYPEVSPIGWVKLEAELVRIDVIKVTRDGKVDDVFRFDLCEHG